MPSLVLVVEDGTGVSGANSYLTLSEASAIHVARLGHEDWEGRAQQDQIRALIDAFQIVEQIAWKGDQAQCQQPNSFPRWGLRKAYRREWFSNEEIPAFLKEFQAELARVRSAAGNPDQQVDLGAEREVQIGGMMVQYDGRHQSALIVPHLLRLISPYIEPTRTVRVA